MFDRTPWRFGGAGLLVLLALLAPLLVSDVQLRLLTEICMDASLALSWNIVSGIAGYISFGHVVFFGVGAYITAILMIEHHVPFLVAVAAATVGAVVLAVLVGTPVLRSRGPYFAIATLGVAEAAKEIFGVAEVFGAGKGWALPINGSATFIYYLLFLLLVATGVITWLILKSRFGLGLMAIREDENAAQAMGVPTTRYKIGAYVLSAVFMGAIGGIDAFYLSYIDNSTAFDSEISVAMLVMALIGGIGTLWGPIIGTVILVVVEHLLWANFTEIHQMVLGLLIMIVVLFLPNGLMPYITGKQRLTFSSLKQTLKDIRL